MNIAQTVLFILENLMIIDVIHIYISNDSNAILKYFQFVLLVVFFLEPQFYTAHAQQRTTFVNCFSSSMIMNIYMYNMYKSVEK
jgi:hypothetical protein